MSLGTSNRDGGKTSESGHLRALAKIVTGDIITGLNAVQRAAGVNMSVDVQVGDAFVRRSDGTYAHPVFNDAVYNQVISAADGSNPRRDIVVIYVDYGQTPSTAVSNNTNGVVKIKVVNGTPAGSPVDPNGAAIQASVGAGNPYSILARVRVPAGQTSISNSLIDDLRTMITSNATTINTAAIINAAVTTAKILDANVTNAKLATGIDSAKLANPYKFSAYRTGASNSINGFTKVLCEAEIFDTGSNFDITTNRRFTAPVAGFYQFSAGVAMGASATPVWQANLYKNGAQHKTGTLVNTNVGFQQSQVSGLIRLAANDYVELWVYASAAVAIAPGAINTYLDGFLVSLT